MLVVFLVLLVQEPIRTAWILSTHPAASPELRKVLPEVHSVTVSEHEVEVRSAGLSMTYLGPFQTPLSPGGGVRELVFRLPRFAEIASHPQRTGPGATGVFLNGVPLYNRFADASFMGRNLWHFDTVARASNLGAIDAVIQQGGTPLLGFALDGFPIYASGRSGYHLRNIKERITWPDGTRLTPGQYGPPVDVQFPLGTFVEDYEYAPRPGELDEFNGRMAVTAEYPNGTYAYFLTVDESKRLAFPYFLAERYRGKVPAAAPIPTSNQRVRFDNSGSIETGTPTRLALSFHRPGGGEPVRYLEVVHERPVHLMVVSGDLAVFDHIHPEWKSGDVYEVWHTFHQPGAYRVFAQFTLPGEAEQVAMFDVDVKGRALATLPGKPPLVVEFVTPAPIRAGVDLKFEVKLKGAAIEPYLGAWAHFVWLNTTLDQFIHAHPNENATAGLDPARPHIHGVSDVPSGPSPASVQFNTNFSRAGTYRLWAQFQVAGRPVVAPFTVEVEPAITKVSPVAPPPEAVRLRVDDKGFTPPRLETSGAVTLAVERANTPNCGSQIVFPSLGITRNLPVGETTLIELPPFKGEVAFACGMGMYRGVIVATVR